MADSLYEANIFVLLKKGKDNTDPAHYRPLSLLNFSQKKIIKVLANRLGNHISTIVHPDQTGSILGHFSFCHAHLLNVLYKDHRKEIPAVILSLDFAQKPFDQIEWPFMKVLECFEFGSLSDKLKGYIDR